MKNKISISANWIAPSRTAAIKFAKSALRYADKTFRLKNTRIIDVIPSKVVVVLKKEADFKKLPSIIVYADTCFRDQAMFRVYISKEHQNTNFFTNHKI